MISKKFILCFFVCFLFNTCFISACFYDKERSVQELLRECLKKRSVALSVINNLPPLGLKSAKLNLKSIQSGLELVQPDSKLVELDLEPVPLDLETANKRFQELECQVTEAMAFSDRVNVKKLARELFELFVDMPDEIKNYKILQSIELINKWLDEESIKK